MAPAAAATFERLEPAAAEPTRKIFYFPKKRSFFFLSSSRRGARGK
jgi:hypothetical protein